VRQADDGHIGGVDRVCVQLTYGPDGTVESHLSAGTQVVAHVPSSVPPSTDVGLTGHEPRSETFVLGL
jgi:hypothetical protein